MHAAFGLHPAIGIVALDLDGRRLDPGFFAGVHFHQFGLEPATLGPAGVHAQQHARPVLAFRPAGPGVNFKVAVIVVGFAGQQRFDLHTGGLHPQLFNGLLGLGDNRGVALGFAQRDQFDIVAHLLGKAAHGAHLHIQLVALAHDVARLLRIAPEIRRLGAGGQVLETGFGSIPVKDASSAGSAPARFRRRLFRFLRASHIRCSAGGAHVVDTGTRINPRAFLPSSTPCPA